MSKPTLSECLRAIAEHENNEEMPNWRRALHDAADALDAHPAPAAHAPGEALRSPDGAKGGVTEAMRAMFEAHRAVHAAEHDPANGRLHGCCLVCGVPWPCKVAALDSGASVVVDRAEWERLQTRVTELGRTANAFNLDATKHFDRANRAEEDRDSLRAKLAEAERELAMVRSNWDGTIDSLGQAAIERDAARAEAERLRGERDEAMKDLAEWLRQFRDAPPTVAVTDVEKAADGIMRLTLPKDGGLRQLYRSDVVEVLRDCTRPADVEAVQEAICKALNRPVDSCSFTSRTAAHAALRALGVLGVREAKPVDRNEVAWLIERPGPLYWSGRDGCGAWTHHLDALRFSRWQDADRARIAHQFEDARAVEHMWIGASPPPNDALGLAARGGEKADEAPASPGAGWLREIAADALNALPNIDPYDDDAHLVDVVVDDPRFESTVRRVAPRFCKVRMPRLRSYEVSGESTAWKAGYNDAITEVAASLRSQGFEVEAGGGT